MEGNEKQEANINPFSSTNVITLEVKYGNIFF